MSGELLEPVVLSHHVLHVGAPDVDRLGRRGRRCEESRRLGPVVGADLTTALEVVAGERPTAAVGLAEEGADLGRDEGIARLAAHLPRLEGGSGQAEHPVGEVGAVLSIGDAEPSAVAVGRGAMRPLLGGLVGEEQHHGATHEGRIARKTGRDQGLVHWKPPILGKITA